MELYILDSLFRRIRIIDKYISLIWTERADKFGDFQLDIYSTYQTRSLLTIDTYVAMSESDYVMRIESFEDDVDAESKRVLIIKGRSYEAILLDRVAKDSLANLTTSPQWTITNPPADVARKVFHDICVTGILNIGDVIPGVVESSLLPGSNIVEPIDPITVDIKPSTVYDVVSNICQTWELGFRFLRDDPTGLMHWDIYAGSDRTSGQTILTPVIFSPQLDNLQNTKELVTIDKAKNVAYVFSPNGFQMVYAFGVDPTVEGFDRRVLMVDASDITTTSTSDVPSALIQRGKEQLSAARIYQGFDGEISQRSQYVYGLDYNLNDLVEMRNIDGVTNDMRVTEQIFVNDATGFRSYPTLSTNIFIATGSWLSWMNNKHWFDLDADSTTWSSQP
jgi:hypothetical protein